MYTSAARRSNALRFNCNPELPSLIFHSFLQRNNTPALSNLCLTRNLIFFLTRTPSTLELQHASAIVAPRAESFGEIPDVSWARIADNNSDNVEDVDGHKEARDESLWRLARRHAGQGQARISRFDARFTAGALLYSPTCSPL